MATNPVKFRYGSYAQYKSVVHDNNALYFITDRGLIYKGDYLCTDNIEVSSFSDSSGNLCLRVTDNTGWETPTQYEIYSITAINNILSSYIAASDAMQFKGVLGTGTGMVRNLPTYGYKPGWCYKVGTAGTYAGTLCEVGDMIISVAEGPAVQQDPPVVRNSDWSVTQANDFAISIPSEGYTLDSSAIIVGNGGRTVRKIPHGSKNQFLGLDNNLDPTWMTISATQLDGTLPVEHGGTGTTSFADGSALIGNGTNPIQTKQILSDTIIGYSDSSALVTAQAVWQGLDAIALDWGTF